MNDHFANDLLRKTGTLNRGAKPSNRHRGVINLTFHGIGEPRRVLDPDERKVWIGSDTFRDMLDCIRGKLEFVLTFDDGNNSDIEVALPELLKRQMTGSFFVPAGRIGAGGSLRAKDLKDLLDAGMTIGSHGMHHRAWRKLENAQLRVEVFDGKDLIEQILGQVVTTVAFPMGAYDRRSLSVVREAGFKRAYTSDGGPANSSDWLQPRNTLHRGDTSDSLMLMRTKVDAVSLFWLGIKRFIKRWR